MVANNRAKSPAATVWRGLARPLLPAQVEGLAPTDWVNNSHGVPSPASPWTSLSVLPREPVIRQAMLGVL